MRLSEAIREGSKETKQIQGWFSGGSMRCEAIKLDYHLGLLDSPPEETEPMTVKEIYSFDGACALGAALLAKVGAKELYHRSTPPAEMCGSEFPILSKKFHDLPSKLRIDRIVSYALDNHCSLNTTIVAHMVIMMNDHLGWSREKIADWVEEVENYFIPEELRKAENKANAIVDSNNKKLKERKEEYVYES